MCLLKLVDAILKFKRMRIGSHEYANEANDDDIPKPAQSLGTLVPRQKGIGPLASLTNLVY